MPVRATVARRVPGEPRHAAMATVIVLVSLLALAVFVPDANAQQEGEARTFDMDVTTNGDTEFCAVGANQEDCVDAGRNVDGNLTVALTGSEGGADITVTSCPEGQSGVRVDLSGTGPEATVNASLTGKAQSNGETQQVDEAVGPVNTGDSGEATVLVCGSSEADAGDDTGDGSPDPGEPNDPLGLLQLIRELLGLDQLPGGGDLPGPGDLPGGDDGEDLPGEGDLPALDEVPPDLGEGPGDGELPGLGGLPPEDEAPGEGDVPDGEAPEEESPDGDSSGEAGGQAGGEVSADSDGNAGASGSADVNSGTSNDGSPALDGVTDSGDGDDGGNAVDLEV